MTAPSALAEAFFAKFGARPRIFRAPGRVNLIGEHTDYNDGFVLPAAIDRATDVAIAPRADQEIRIHSRAFGETRRFALSEANPAPLRDWSDYARGVVVELLRLGVPLRGADLMIDSDLPMGAGLSASAAFEVATAFALCSLSGAALDPTALALACQRAENEFVGMRCGVMDQLISSRGVEGSALLIDCRSLEARPTPMPPDVAIVICDTMVQHELAASAYNERREQCETAVALLGRDLPGLRALRDVDASALAKGADILPQASLRRARHVVSENARVLKMVEALAAQDLAACGALMNESHRSLRDDYEVSCAELDLMAALAQSQPGAYGARMTGGGFGGCVVSLVEKDAVADFIAQASRDYLEKTGLEAQIFCARPSAGVGEIAF